jgi:hypothetical protein
LRSGGRGRKVLSRRTANLIILEEEPMPDQVPLLSVIASGKSLAP